MKRKYHTFIYETMQDLVCDNRHRVWQLAYKLSELRKSDVNDVVHEAVMYVVKNDKLYQEVETIIESGGSYRGFLFNVYYIYLCGEIRKVLSSQDALDRAKNFTEIIDKEFPFKKERALQFSFIGDDNSIDTYLYRHGAFQKSCEEEFNLREMKAIADEILGPEIAEMQ